MTNIKKSEEEKAEIPRENGVRRGNGKNCWLARLSKLTNESEGEEAMKLANKTQLVN